MNALFVSGNKKSVLLDRGPTWPIECNVAFAAAFVAFVAFGILGVH